MALILLSFNQHNYSHSILIHSQTQVEQWHMTNWQDLSPSDFGAIPTKALDIFLIGSGQQHRFVPQSIYTFFQSQQIALEVMTTPAACRTYNVLVAENRRVAIALIIDKPA